MLGCLFGRCSSETYVVNQFPKTDRERPVKITNGISKIVPVSSEPATPTTIAPPNNQNTETIKITAPAARQPVVQQNEQSNSQDNEAVKKIAPTPPEISLQKNGEVHENTEKEENNTQTLSKKENNENIHKENNIAVPLKTRSQAPKPPEVKVTVDVEDKVLTTESREQNKPVSKVTVNVEDKVLATESREQHKPVSKVTVDAEDKVLTTESREQHKPVSKVTVDVEDKVLTTESREQHKAVTKVTVDKEDKVLRTESREQHKPVLKVTVDVEDKVLTTESRKQHEPVLKETEPNKKEYSEVRNEVNHNSVTSKADINSEQNENNKKDKGKVSIDTQDQIIVDQKRENYTKQEKKDEKRKVRIETQDQIIVERKPEINTKQEEPIEVNQEPERRRSGVVPLPVKYDETIDTALKHHYPKDPDDEDLIKSAIERNDFLNKIISGKRLDDVVRSMYNREIASKETIIKQGEKGSHMYISAKGKYQVVVKGKVVSEFDDVRVFGELAILYNDKRLASIKALTPGRVWVLDRPVYQQIMLRYNIKEQDEIMLFLMKNKTLNVVGEAVLQEVANLLKPEFFLPGKQIVRQGDKGHKFYIIRAGTVTITKEGEGVVGLYEKGDCFGELALLKEDCRQATVTANAPGVECLTLTRKEFIDYFGEVDDITKLKPRPQNSIKDVVEEHGDINLADLKIIKTLGVGGFGRVELVQHTKKKDLVFALKYLKKIDIVLQHQQEHVYNEKNIQMSSKSPFIIRLYRTYRDNKYIYFLMESCLGGDLWSLLQKQKVRRFDEKEARFIAACVLEAFDYLHSRGIVYRDLKPENLLIAANGYIKLTDFGFAKKISSRGKTYTFAGTPEYVAPEIVLNKGHDRAVDYWAFGAFIFELLTGRTPFRTDDSSHMKTYNKILNGIDNIQFPSYVNLKARHIVEKLCRPIPVERLGMQKGGIKDIKAHKWFLGWDWQKFAKCEIPSPFKPKLKSPTDTQYFDQFKKDSDNPPDELSGWDMKF